MENIPSSLLATLFRIKRYLDGGRAAVMVGSGFSKNADMAGNVRMKDWRELIDDIFREVYGKKPEESDLVLTTPMRIASLVETTYGEAALDELIEQSLPDKQVQPGELHRKLMSLPWTDVFTTNYDTLLERAGEQTKRAYHLVTNKDALLYQKRPRIVKLHGSFPDHHPYIMSEEHFRTYPQRYPEMVNTVRQALIENLFCLIGFSGDDPNFLSWLGWLHDVMGKATQPIFCITYSKNLQQPEVKLFHDRGIEIVNLYEIEGLDGFKDAFEFFFDFLAEKPKVEQWSGGPIRNKLYMDFDTKALTEKMREIRESYPGWLLLPSRYRSQFSDAVWGMVKCGNEKLAQEPLGVQVDYLYELDWRLSISLTPKLAPEYQEALERVVYTDGETDEKAKERLISLSNSLLTIYRQTGDEESFEKLKTHIAKRYGAIYSQQYKRYSYECGLMLLWQQDYQELNRLLDGWQVQAEDFEPVLWKTSLLYEAGRAQEAVQLLSLADAFVSRQSLQQGTPDEYIRTCRMQIQKSLSYYRRDITPLDQQIEEGRTQELTFERNLCDLWEIRSGILADFNKDRNWSERTERHSFNIGRHTTTWHGSTGYVPYFRHPMALLLLHEQAGYPLSASVNELRQMLPALAGYLPLTALRVSVVSGDSETMEKTADRQTLGALKRAEANRLADHLTEVYEAYSQSRYARVRNRMNEVVLPLLTRLSVMVSQDRIERLARRVLQMNEMVRDKYMRTLCDCMEEMTKKSLIDAILRAPVYDGRYEVLPELHDKDYRADEDALDALIGHLGEGGTMVRRNAYLRLKLYYQHTDNDEHRAKIAGAVRSWRADGTLDAFKLESLNYIPFDAGLETCDPVELAHSKVETFSVVEHTLGRNSVGIENLRGEVEELVILLDFTTDADKKRVVEVLLDVMEKNRDVMQKDDSKEMMGGLRHFTMQLMMGIEQYLVHTLPLCDEAIVRRAFTLLEEYAGYGFRVAPAMVCCLQRTGEEDKLRELTGKLCEQLMEEEAGAAADAIAALAMLERAQIPDSLFDIVGNYIRFARRYHARYLIQFLCVMVMKDKATESDMQCCLKVLEDVGHLVGRYDTDQDQSSDIIYESFLLSGMMYSKREDLRENPVLLSWKALAENDEVFNDQRVGWKNRL